MLWTRWRYGGEGPQGVYEAYNGLGSWPPRNPDRLTTLLMAFGLFAHDSERRLAGQKVSTRGFGG